MFLLIVFYVLLSSCIRLSVLCLLSQPIQLYFLSVSEWKMKLIFFFFVSKNIQNVHCFCSWPFLLLPSFIIILYNFFIAFFFLPLLFRFFVCLPSHPFLPFLLALFLLLTDHGGFPILYFHSPMIVSIMSPFSTCFDFPSSQSVNGMLCRWFLSSFFPTVNKSYIVSVSTRHAFLPKINPHQPVSLVPSFLPLLRLSCFSQLSPGWERGLPHLCLLCN